MKKAFCMFMVIAVLLSFSGCKNSEVANQDNSKILVYLSGPEQMLNKLEQEFENEYGDVCDFLIMSCGQVKSKIFTEKEAGKIEADIVWGSDPAVYNLLDNENLFEPIDIKEKDKIQDKYLVKKNYALTSERYVAILYNKNKLKDKGLVTSFADLAKEEYKNSLVMADANQSATALGIAASLYQIMGNDMTYFENLKSNGAMLTKSNGQVPSKIMEGEYDLGIGPHDSVIRLKKKAKKEEFTMPVEIAWPSEGIIAIDRPMAIVKKDNRSTEKAELCQKFVNFILSKKAQTIAYNAGFVSVREDIENKYLPEDAKVFNIDWEKATKNESKFKKDYQNIFK